MYTSYQVIDRLLELKEMLKEDYTKYIALHIEMMSGLKTKPIYDKVTAKKAIATINRQIKNCEVAYLAVFHHLPVLISR